jgi:uncharacterized protein
LQTRVAANAQALTRWLCKAEEVLGNHSDRLNAINIFPVADGDTGTNLYLTVRSAAAAASAAGTQDIGELLAVAGRAAMEEARGNSGTLFSVFLSAMAEPLQSATRLTGPLLAAALERGQIRSWSALSDPVQGTLLSVLEAAARAASEAGSGQHDDSNSVLTATVQAAVDAALEAVVRTESQLGALAEAHVVDAGGVGFLLIMDALRASLLGEALKGELLDGLHGYDVQDPHIHEAMPPASGVELMCTIELSPLDAATLRMQLDEFGDSVIMSAVSEVEEGYRWRVHVHVPDADAALGIISGVGDPMNVTVTQLTAAAEDVHGH